MPTDDPPPSRHYLFWIIVLVGVFLTIPVALVVFVFPMLSEQAFDSPAALDPDRVESLAVRLLNRTELDGGDDVGPFFADRADFAALLAPLRGVPAVADFADARGPWLGEYRVRLTDGRKGTIRLYWVRSPVDERALPGFAALYGGAAYRSGTAARHLPAARLRLQVGGNKFEGNGVSAVIRAAEAAKTRGR